MLPVDGLLGAAADARRAAEALVALGREGRAGSVAELGFAALPLSRTPDVGGYQAIVGLGGQVFMRKNSQDAVREFRPYFDHAPVYGGGPSLEDFSSQPPLTVGSPEQAMPVLRREIAALEPAHVPDAPTHASLLAAREAQELAAV